MGSRTSTKVVEADQVRPFIATVEPMVDESLLGFFIRTLSGTAVRRPQIGAALAGIDIAHAHFLASTISDPIEIRSLATLLGTNDREVLSRLTPRMRLENDQEGFSFFGTAIRNNLWIPRRQRRISPQALKKTPHHRAIWDILPISFDPDTLEVLLSECPVCGRTLGWLHAQGIHMCDRCVDDRGLPTVDLRDFPQPPVECDFPESLRVLTGLVDPRQEQARLARNAIEERWRDLSNGQIFDSIIDLASAVTTEQTDYGLARGRHAVSGLTPQALALATRAFTGGGGLSDVAQEVGKRARERAGGKGIVKVFGPLRKMARRKEIHEKVRAAISETIGQHRQGGASPVYPDYPGRMDPRQLSAEFGMPWHRFHRLANSNHLSVVRLADKPGSPRLMLVEEVAHLVDLVRDAMTRRQVAQALAIPESEVDELGLVEYLPRIDGPAKGLLGKLDYYKKSDIKLLLGYVWALAERVDSVRALPTVGQVLKSMSHRPIPYAGALSALAGAGAGAVYVVESPTDWQKHLHVTNLNEFVSRVESELAYLSSMLPRQRLIPAKTVADLLGIRLNAVSNLLKAGLLKDWGTTHSLFRHDEVMAFRAQYVTAFEASKIFGTGRIRIRAELRDWDIHPVVEFDGTPIAIFERRLVEWAGRTKMGSATDPHRLNVRKERNERS